MILRFLILFILFAGIQHHMDARKPDNIDGGNRNTSDITSWRAACVRPTKQIEMQVNNVRARLLTGGDIWSEAQYIVPKPAPGQLPVSALFAGGVWIGGVDRAGNIKLSGVTYRSQGYDFFSDLLTSTGPRNKSSARIGTGFLQ